MNAKRILVIGMTDSIHLARWLGQFVNSGHDFYIFTSSPARRTRPELLALIEQCSGKSTFRLVGPKAPISAFFWLIDRLAKDRVRGYWLRKVIGKVQPEIVHCLEMQHAGYIYLASNLHHSADGGPEPTHKLMVTNWGSDIFWFRQFPLHAKKIGALLALAKTYSSECARDVHLAKEFGFVGEIRPVLPNSGGIPSEVVEATMTPPSDRDIIMIKGYHGWVGRGALAVSSLSRISAELEGCEIVVYSCNGRTIREARRIRRNTNLKIATYRKGKLSHKEMLDLFGRSKLHVGVSLSDAISTAVIESMATGAIPVQTSTACVDEWFTTTGVVIEEISEEAISDAILEGLQLASSNAWLTNKEIVLERASIEIVDRLNEDFYH